MEMENSGISSMVAMQTNILEEIREMRKREEFSRLQQHADNGAGAMGVSANADALSLIGQVDTQMPDTSNGMLSSNDLHIQAKAIAEGAASIQQAGMISTPLDSYGNDFSTQIQRDNFADIAPELALMDKASEIAPLNEAMSMANNITGVRLDKPMSYSQVSDMYKDVKREATDISKENIGSIASDYSKFDASRMSRQQIENHFSKQTQSIQQTAVDTGATAVGLAGAAAGLLVPGILPGLAVGAVASGVAASAVDGAKDSLRYQDILQKDGYRIFNAMESTSDFGGIGIGLSDRQEMSKFMRHLGTEQMMDSDEMAQILQGGIDNKLLRSVKDTKQFEEKFRDIVKTVKEVSITLNQSIDETMEFLGEMDRRGVTLKDTRTVAAQAKVAASMLGEDASVYTDQVLERADALTAGTMRTTESAVKELSYNSYAVDAVDMYSRQTDGRMAQFIKNSGGTEAVAGEFAQAMNSYFREGSGDDHIVALYAQAFEEDEAGKLTLNEEKVKEINASGKSVKELRRESQQALKGFDKNTIAALSTNAGEIFTSTLDYSDQQQAMSNIIKTVAESGKMTEESAMQVMNLTNDKNQAELYSQMMIVANDDATHQQMNLLVEQEKWDSADLANSPGLMKRLKYGYKEMVGDTIGDYGQYASDFVGNKITNVQSAVTGIDKKNQEKVSIDFDLTHAETAALFEQDSDAQKEKNDLYEELGMKRTERDITPKKRKGMLDNEYKEVYEKAKKRSLSFEEIANLQDRLEDEDVHFRERDQIEFLLKAQGGGGALGSFGVAVGGKVKSWGTDKMDETSVSGGKESFENLEKVQKDIQKQRAELDKKLMTEFEKGGFDRKDASKVDEALKEKDYKTLQELAKTEKAEKVVKEYKGLGDEAKKVDKLADLKSNDVYGVSSAITATENIAGILKESGAYTDEEMEQFFGKTQKTINKAAKKDRKALMKMSDDELQSTFEKFDAFGEDLLKGRSQAELAKISEYIAGVNNKDVDSFKNDDGKYDAKMLQQEIYEVSRKTQTSGSAAEEALKNKLDPKILKDHSNAMSEFTETIVQETAELRSQVAAVKRNKKKLTTNT